MFLAVFVVQNALALHKICSISEHRGPGTCGSLKQAKHKEGKRDVTLSVTEFQLGMREGSAGGNAETLQDPGHSEAANPAQALPSEF